MGITDHVQAEHPRKELIDAPELGEHVYSKHLMCRYGQIWQGKITILDVPSPPPSPCGTGGVCRA